MILPQSHIICYQGHTGTVGEDTLHNKPDTPDLMGKKPSIGDSRNSEHSGPNITFDRCEQLHSQHSHGVFEALVLKTLLSWSPQSPRRASSLVVVGSAAAVAVALPSASSKALFSLICRRFELVSAPLPTRPSSREAGISGRTLVAANCGKIN